MNPWVSYCNDWRLILLTNMVTRMRLRFATAQFSLGQRSALNPNQRMQPRELRSASVRILVWKSVPLSTDIASCQQAKCSNFFFFTLYRKFSSFLQGKFLIKMTCRRFTDDNHSARSFIKKITGEFFKPATSVHRVPNYGVIHTADRSNVADNQRPCVDRNLYALFTVSSRQGFFYGYGGPTSALCMI